MLDSGPYRVLREIARGGQGSVLLAHDPRLARYVALKRYSLPDTRGARRRALAEARRLAAIDSPRVTRIHDIVTSDTELLLVMQYVPGCDLSQPLATRQLSLASSLAIASDVAAGLAASSAQGSVHGDLKPSNVLIAENGRALLTDFGVALPDASQLALGGSRVALAPEHLRGEPLTVKSDMFAFGRLLYRMVCGFDPFTGAGGDDALLAGDYLSPASSATNIPPHLAHLLDALLQPAPADRPRSISEIRQGLREVIRHLPPQPRSVVREVADCFRSERPADIPPALPGSLQRESRRKERFARWRRALQTPRFRTGTALFAVAMLSVGTWRLAVGFPCVSVTLPRMSLAPGTAMNPQVTSDWLQSVLLASVREQRQLQLTGDGVPNSPVFLGADGPESACKPRERLGIVLECRPSLCFLGLETDAGTRQTDMALFPDAGADRWSAAIERLVSLHYP